MQKIWSFNFASDNAKIGIDFKENEKDMDSSSKTSDEHDFGQAISEFFFGKDSAASQLAIAGLALSGLVLIS